MGPWSISKLFTLAAVVLLVVAALIYWGVLDGVAFAFALLGIACYFASQLPWRA